MDFSQEILYEQSYSIRVNKETDSLFYYFDYDERSYDINMEFQHFHPFYEIFILLDTKASHIIDGKYFPLKMYDMVLLRPALLHKSEYPPGPPRKRIIIDFNIPIDFAPMKNSMEKIFSIFNVAEPVYRFSPNLQKKLFSMLNEIFMFGKNTASIRDVAVNTKFIEFLYTIYSESKRNIYKMDIKPDTNEFRMYTVTSWIHEHYQQPITLELLAEHFNMSPYYLSHLFRKVTGFTVVNYVQMTRIRNVQQLLLYTQRKVTDIAESCGFTSFSQFNRTFNKFCNISPSDYRKSPNDGERLLKFNE